MQIIKANAKSILYIVGVLIIWIIKVLELEA